MAVALTPKLNSNISECFHPDIDETSSVVKEFDDRLKYATFEIETFSCEPAAKETTNPPTVNTFNRLMEASMVRTHKPVLKDETGTRYTGINHDCPDTCMHQTLISEFFKI